MISRNSKSKIWLIKSINIRKFMDSKRGLFVREGDCRIPSISIPSSRRKILPKITFKEPERISPSKIVSINRQITSGMIVDQKESKVGGQKVKEIQMRSGDGDNRTIFSYVIEKQINPQQSLVTYRWIKRSKKIEESTYLLEEEHIYHGHILNGCKNGEAEYTIIRKYSDHSEKHQIIKGIWSNDILQSGTVVDENGEEKPITTGNRVKKSTKIIQPFLERNKTIRQAALQIKKSSKLIPSNESKKSLSLIIHSNDGLQLRQHNLCVPVANHP